MKFSFKFLLSTVPHGSRYASKVVAARLSVRKEERKNLSTSNRLNMVKAAKEGGRSSSPSLIQMDRREVTSGQYTTFI